MSEFLSNIPKNLKVILPKSKENVVKVILDTPPTIDELAEVRQRQKNLFIKDLTEFINSYLTDEGTDKFTRDQKTAFDGFVESSVNNLLPSTIFEHITEEDITAIINSFASFRDTIQTHAVAEAVQKFQIGGQAAKKAGDRQYAEFLAELMPSLGIDRDRVEIPKNNLLSGLKQKLEVFLPAKKAKISPKTVTNYKHPELILPKEAEADLHRVQNFTKLANGAEALYAASLSLGSGPFNTLFAVIANSALYPIFINLFERNAENKNASKNDKNLKAKAMSWALTGTAMTTVFQPAISSVFSDVFVQEGVRMEVNAALSGKMGKTPEQVANDSIKSFAQDPVYSSYIQVRQNLEKTRDEQVKRYQTSTNPDEQKSAQGRLVSGFGVQEEKSSAKNQFDNDQKLVNNLINSLRIARNKKDTANEVKLIPLINQAIQRLATNGEKAIGLNATVKYLATIETSIKSNSGVALVELAVNQAGKDIQVDQLLQNQELLAGVLGGDSTKARDLIKIYNKIAKGQHVNIDEGLGFAATAIGGLPSKIMEGKFNDKTVVNVLTPFIILGFIEIVLLGFRGSLLDKKSKYAKLSLIESQQTAKKYAEVIINLGGILAIFDPELKLETANQTTIQTPGLKSMLDEIVRVFGIESILYLTPGDEIFRVIENRLTREQQEKVNFAELHIKQLREEKKAEHERISEIQSKKEQNASLKAEFKQIIPSLNKIIVDTNSSSANLIEGINNYILSLYWKFPNALELPENENIKKMLNLYTVFRKSFLLEFTDPIVLNEIPQAKHFALSLVKPLERLLKMDPNTPEFQNYYLQMESYTENPFNHPQITSRFNQIKALYDTKEVELKQQRDVNNSKLNKLEQQKHELDFQNTIITMFDDVSALYDNPDFRKGIVEKVADTKLSLQNINNPEYFQQVSPLSDRDLRKVSIDARKKLAAIKEFVARSNASYDERLNITPLAQITINAIGGLEVIISKYTALNLAKNDESHSYREYLAIIPYYIVIIKNFLSYSPLSNKNSNFKNVANKLIAFVDNSTHDTPLFEEINDQLTSSINSQLHILEPEVE